MNELMKELGKVCLNREICRKAYEYHVSIPDPLNFKFHKNSSIWWENKLFEIEKHITFLQKKIKKEIDKKTFADII